MRRSHASVTVFLALIFLILLSFICTLLESVRIRMANVYYQYALASAVESTEAGYCKELFEEYGLLFYWPDGVLIQEETEAFFSHYTQPDRDLAVSGVILYSLTEQQIQAERIMRAGDNGAQAFRKQMIAEGKTELPAGIAAVLQGRNGLIAQGDQLQEELGQEKEKYETTDWYQMRTEITEEEIPFEEAENQKKEWEEQMKQSISSSLFENLREWAGHPFLSLVLSEDTELSNKGMDLSLLDAGFPEAGQWELQEASALQEKILIHEYILQHCGNWISPAEGNGLAYEAEYVLCGLRSDEENLNKTAEKLLRMREGLNLLWLLQDADSLKEAGLLADSLVGWMMIPALTESVKAVFLSCWAFAESVVDVRKLLEGGKVPFLKEKEEWEVTLERIPLLLSGNGWEQKESANGLCYRDYLRLLLLKQEEMPCVSRMAGLIQFRMREKNAAFSLRDCISEAWYRFEGKLTDGFLWNFGWIGEKEKIHGITIYRKFDYEAG